MAPSFPAKCNRCGEEEDVRMGFLYILYYCTRCRKNLNEKEQKAWSQSRQLVVEATRKILSRKL